MHATMQDRLLFSHPPPSLNSFLDWERRVHGTVIGPSITPETWVAVLARQMTGSGIWYVRNYKRLRSIRNQHLCCLFD